MMPIISFFIRQLFLPNPFECFGSMAFAYNFVSEPIIHILAFNLVGIVYNKGESPEFGSFLYLLVYSLIIGILYLMGIFSFAWWWVCGIILSINGIGRLLKRLYMC